MKEKFRNRQVGKFSNRTTKQRYVHMPGAVFGVIITLTETKILKVKVVTLSEIASLLTVIEIKQLTLVLFI